MKKDPEQSPFATLIDCMKDDGLATAAKRLDLLLHNEAGTTGSEFQGDFGLEMKRIKRSPAWYRMSRKTKATFGSVAAMILKVWPAIGLDCGKGNKASTSSPPDL